MEVVTRPVKTYHTESNSSTPYVSAPSSPKCFGDRYDYYYSYTSAPTSPARALAIYDHFKAISLSSTSAATAAATTTTTTTTKTDIHSDDDFAFDFSGHLEKEGDHPSLTAADELFDSGIIRPLNRIPKEHIKESTRDRGRERANSFSPSISHPHSRSRKGSRSLSPLRRGGIGDTTDGLLADKSPTTSPAPSAAKGGGGSRKWRLRDLLLFRSASEGRATGNRSKDPLRKYTLLTSSPTRGLIGEDSKNSSFRSTASNGSRPVRSAHEKHYTANRAAAEELKKKTALPYRQGLFGCLRFNPAVNSIARGFTGQSFNQRRP
ncbi:hypothetical protein J5N97_009728 [Dioscorea zingiberensis]|uniref:Uncharacterized protein n=1 Tax=Dioscorea zingiberensis TaxID=325984 RepID=A0A9D5CZX8_9LILI|nr:hypothetical protein J5N97_009728 [Dioscorea zingiberensis]